MPQILKKRLLYSFVLLTSFIVARAQTPPVIMDNLLSQEVDTNYINLDKGRLSIRTFVVFKNHGFRILNNDYGLQYAPNNRMGIGIGFAYYPLLLDIGINIKIHKEEASKRMDLQGELMTNKAMFTAYLQNYNGFNISGDQLTESEFRNDIQTLTLGLYYFRIVNSDKISLRSVITGSAVQKKSFGSFALGGGLNYGGLRADSSIVPYSQQNYFNDHAQITKMSGFNGGIKGGYVGVLVLPHGFFFFASVFPGIGISVKEISSSETYIPVNWLNLDLDLHASFGYNGSRIYSTIGLVNYWSTSSLDYGNRIFNNSGRIKWVIGFKI